MSFSFLVTVYDPSNWYWYVQDQSPTTQVWSSNSASYVPLTDSTFQAFLAKGNVPTTIPSQSALGDVLIEQYPAGSPVPPTFGGPSSDVSIYVTGDVQGSGDVTTSASIPITLTLSDVGTAGTYSVAQTDQNGRVIVGDNLVITGDVTGVANGNTVAVALANIASQGVFNQVVVDDTGRVTSGTFTPIPSMIPFQATGDVTGEVADLLASPTVAFSLANTGVTAGTYTAVVVNDKGLVTFGSNGVTVVGNATNVFINAIGDVFANDDLLANSTVVFTLANSGVTAGTYTSVVVNSKGLVTFGSNATNTDILINAVGDVIGHADLTTNSIISLSLLNRGVTFGTYNSVTVNAQGLVVAANNVNSNVSINAIGDITGSGNLSSNSTISFTLANSGVTTGTFNSVVVNAKGLVISGTFANTSSSDVLINATGDIFGSGDLTTNSIVTFTLANSGVVAGTYTSLVVNSKGLVTHGNTASDVFFNAMGDVTGSGDLTASPVVTLTLSATGVSPGTYSTVVVNSKGLVIFGSNTAGGIANVTINAIGDVTANGNLTTNSVVTFTLANSGVTSGTYTSVVVNSKGLVTHGANAANVIINAIGDVTGSGNLSTNSTVNFTFAGSGVAAGTYNTVVVNTKGLVTFGSLGGISNVVINAIGDVIGNGNLTTNSAVSFTIANSGVTAGTYNSVTVNSKGLVTAASNVVSNVVINAIGDVIANGNLTTSSFVTFTLQSTGVTAGTYTSVVVNSKGLVTFGSNASSGSGGSVDYTQLPSEVQSVYIPFSFTGKPTAGAKIGYSVVETATISSTGILNSASYAANAATSSATFTVGLASGAFGTYPGAITILGTVIFAPGNYAGATSVAISNTVTVNYGDWIFLQAPAVQDATLATVSVTILGQKT